MHPDKASETGKTSGSAIDIDASETLTVEDDSADGDNLSDLATIINLKILKGDHT